MADLKLNDQQYKTHEEQAIEFYAKVFDRDIQEAAKVSERWVARDPPTPLPISQYWKSGQKCSAGDQSVGNVQDMAALLIDSFVKVLETRSSDIGAITFDKDDKLAMDFVSAASNLRMKNFGIPNMSTFDVKGIAGNIIHAIATTNAIAAGLMVLQAQHILKKDYDSCRSTWIRTTGPSVLQPEKMRSPNPKCTICSLAHILVTVNTEAYTLEQFFSDVLMNELKFTDEADVDVENRK
jgi:ubiquitin-like 1-activating enzyme E1 B